MLAPPAQRLLGRVDVTPQAYLDVGAGTGGLVLAAAERWPGARIIALDASAGMLSVGRQRVADELPQAGERFAWIAADAADMPLAEASVDVASACFMLQLVDDRMAVLREIRRVTRPGGTVGLVTWLAGDLILPADEVFEAAVKELGLDEESGGFRPSRTTDYSSLDEAREELSDAGFSTDDVRADELHHAWTREGYLRFKERYDDRELFEALDHDARAHLRDLIQARWAALPESAFEVHGPLVSAIARRL